MAPATEHLARPAQALAASSCLPLQPARSLPRPRRDASNGVTTGSLHLGPDERLRDSSPARSSRRDRGAQEPPARPLPRGEIRPRAQSFPGVSGRGHAAEGLGPFSGSGRRSGGELLRPAHPSRARQDPCAGGNGARAHAFPCRRIRSSPGSKRARACPCPRCRARDCAGTRAPRAGTAGIGDGSQRAGQHASAARGYGRRTDSCGCANASSHGSSRLLCRVRKNRRLLHLRRLRPRRSNPHWRPRPRMSARFGAASKSRKTNAAPGGACIVAPGDESRRWNPMFIGLRPPPTSENRRLRCPKMGARSRKRNRLVLPAISRGVWSPMWVAGAAWCRGSGH